MERGLQAAPKVRVKDKEKIKLVKRFVTPGQKTRDRVPAKPR